MEKTRLFEITFKKLSGDRAFMAFYLNELMLRENRSTAEVILLLNCSPENYYQLALCKAPALSEPNFKERLKKISAYTGISEVILTNLIDFSSEKKVVSPGHPAFLEECWSVFKKWLPFPSWVYKPMITVLLVILLVVPLFSKGNETNALQLYIDHYVAYTDSVRHIVLPDNSSVHRYKL